MKQEHLDTLDKNNARLKRLLTALDRKAKPNIVKEERHDAQAARNRQLIADGAVHIWNNLVGE